MGRKRKRFSFRAARTQPAVFSRHPKSPDAIQALIVVHEWWGLNDWVKEQTVKLASQGFVALAVDLYRGKVAADPAEAHELSRGACPNDRAILDLMAGIVYLTTRNDVDRGRIGTIGWCMGGGYAVQLAMHVPRLGACVVNYGALPTDPNDTSEHRRTAARQFRRGRPRHHSR